MPFDETKGDTAARCTDTAKMKMSALRFNERMLVLPVAGTIYITFGICDPLPTEDLMRSCRWKVILPQMSLVSRLAATDLND